jgi:hypothetical protein
MEATHCIEADTFSDLSTAEIDSESDENDMDGDD